jgi:hypothetical protein
MTICAGLTFTYFLIILELVQFEINLLLWRQIWLLSNQA